MRKAVCGIVMSCLMASQAMADVTWDQIIVSLTEANGSVDVVIASPPDYGSLEDLLSIMILSTANQIRIGVAPGMQGRQKTIDRIEGFIADRGLSWSMCQGWWDTEGAGVFAKRVRDEFGGSLVFIDNGASSSVIDGDADFELAIEADPAFAAMTGPSPFMISDRSAYFNAVEVFWSRIVPTHDLDPNWWKENGGWIDGC